MSFRHTALWRANGDIAREKSWRLIQLAHCQNSNAPATLCGAANGLQLLREVVGSRAWHGDFDAKRGVGFPEFLRVKQAVGVALLHGGFERRDGAVVESFTQRGRNWLARVFAFG